MMKAGVFLLLVFLLIFSAHSVTAQTQDSLTNDSLIDDGWIIDPISTIPEFVGGEVAMYDFLRKNIAYPKQALNNRTEGVVWIAFVIDTSGAVSNAVVRHGIGDGCNEEAIRVVSMMPDWTPGYLGEKPVRTQLCIPIRYVLDNNNDSVLSELKPGEHYDYEEIIEIAPEFPGGTKALQKFVKRHKKYPKAAKENKISGTVYISFVIDETGNISNAKILRGLGYGCDEEALRIILLMPKWIPAQTKEKPVQCYYNLAVKFGNNKSIK